MAKWTVGEWTVTAIAKRAKNISTEGRGAHSKYFLVTKRANGNTGVRIIAGPPATMVALIVRQRKPDTAWTAGLIDDSSWSYAMHPPNMPAFAVNKGSR